MSQISLPEAADLLGKLLSERIPLVAFFWTTSGLRILMPGFVDAITNDHGLVISVSGPPIETDRGYMNVRPFDRDCWFLYGERRELPEEMQHLRTHGESVLEMRFPDSGERLALFFTL